ncbi:PLP-dependent aminotransferase family protein [Cohaesibacter celericrescens]|uniref:PLP-dependent aminotransferase family protein n=1 Tax=Cohaesibacter celericrescens TaxID=2067669 RepID=A0A2N5XKA8_9HYPH|nr:PLP-dependent aminotransferase family protein [Cohaesibacter celericrescens]PLW74914.1 PLP-dependent aminotransferase family protein [Cohaesibacter celericrescens]
MKDKQTDWCPDISDLAGPKYRAIVSAMQKDIQDGILLPGARLPTQRDLAWSLKVNLSTVTEAFREATRLRLITGEVGRGTYVLPGNDAAQLYAMDRSQTENMIDLSTIIPARAFSDEDVRQSFATLLARDNLADMMDYNSPNLIKRCRNAIAQLYQARGFHPRQTDIFPCAGAQAALFAALQMVAKPDLPVLVEELTFPGMKVAARQMGLRLVPVTMDDRGILPEDLDRAARASGARILVVSPILQNPTGTTMDAARRAEIARLAEKLDLLVIEEDVYGGFSKEPPLSLQLAGRSILVGGLSKLVAPGPRFGFIISTLEGEDRAPVGLNFSTNELVHVTSWMAAPIMLELACNWIEKGEVDNHMEWQRQEARARQGLLRRKLGLPALGRAPAAPHIWIPTGASSQLLGGLPNHPDCGTGEQMAAKASAAGVALVPASTFCAGRIQSDGVRLCVTAPLNRSDLTEACKRLNKAWE